MPTKQERFRHLWAKTSREMAVNETMPDWHPLILHLVDVAVVADAVLGREPERSREILADALQLKWDEAKPWLLLLAACHDLGKAFPGFQSCSEARIAALRSDGLDMPNLREGYAPHGAVTCGELAVLLMREEFGGWKKKFAERAAEAAGSHHGARFPQTMQRDARHRFVAGNAVWGAARHEIFSCLHRLFGLGGKAAPTKKSLSGAEFMRLAGWISFSDWIASDEALFPYGTVDDLDNLEAWREHRHEIAERALDGIGWHTRISPASTGTTFEKLFFGASPRPLQKAVAEQAEALSIPSVMLVEAPMGEGKTEAAWHAHLLLRERLGHRGLYLALPTRATGNAMFARVLDFLCSPALRENMQRDVDFQLLHGSSSLNADYKNLRLNGIHENDDAGKNAEADGGVRAGEWFTQKKRALLSEYGVGTVDQALLSILPVRHNFIRMWGLANRVVALDEVHAYDTYTTKLIVTLVEWLVELGSSVILLSATVPPKFRRDIAESLGVTLPESEKTYPRLTVFTRNSPARQIHFDANEEGRRTVLVERLGTDVSALSARLENFPKGTALALVNTVDRAQKLYSLFPSGELLLEGKEEFVVGKRLTDGSEVYLFHSRFPADERQHREERILKEFGKNAGRSGRKILIATQVAEQSLDLDFDFMISDLAPTDLLLQRAGRLWRHKRSDRDAAEPVLAVSGLTGNEPPDFGKPLWWGAVYREDLLLLSWIQWRGLESVMLPDDIDSLVTTVYEKSIPVPRELQERYDKSESEAEGEILAHGSLAAMAGIGHPDEFFTLTESGIAFDDDDVLLGGSKKKAATRLGDMSATVIVLPVDSDPAKKPEKLYCRALPITRKSIIVKLHTTGVPKEWSRSSLLRNAYPFTLTPDGCWTEDASVRLDPELGLCYG